MSDHLALVLQGGGAGPWTAPILIPSLALEEVGATVEVVPYPEFRPESLEVDAARDFDERVTLSLRKIVDSGAWSHITFVAKSRGTLYLAAIRVAPLRTGGRHLGDAAARTRLRTDRCSGERMAITHRRRRG